MYVLGGNVDGVVKMKFRGHFAGRNGILDREMCQYGSQLSIDALIFNEINMDVQAPVVVMKGVFLLAVRMIHGQRERHLFHSNFHSLKVDFFGQSHIKVRIVEMLTMIMDLPVIVTSDAIVKDIHQTIVVLY